MTLNKFCSIHSLFLVSDIHDHRTRSNVDININAIINVIDQINKVTDT